MPLTSTEYEYSVLLSAVCRLPDDDGPRMEMADWYDIQGMPERAELIRVQCELESLTADGKKIADAASDLAHCLCRQCTLYRRSRDLLTVNGEQWAANELVIPCGWELYTDWNGRNWTYVYGNELRQGESRVDGSTYERLLCWEWSRGFISILECTAETLMGIAGKLGNLLPLTACRLTDRIPEYVEPESNNSYYHWLSSGIEWREAEEYIPGSVYAWLPRGRSNGFRYNSAEAANSALATAAAAYCRSLAE